MKAEAVHGIIGPACKAAIKIKYNSDSVAIIACSVYKDKDEKRQFGGFFPGPMENTTKNL